MTDINKRYFYKLELDLTVASDIESLEFMAELLTGRINEMLGKLEHKDYVKIVLVRNCEVNRNE